MAFGLFGLALALRLVFAVQIPFPPLDDPAYYVQGARSFGAGHPLTLDITWNYNPLFDTVRRPGFDFWMPLTSFLIAGSFAIFGDNMLASQLPEMLGGALLAPLTYFLARRAFATLGLENRGVTVLSGLAGLYIALNPLLAYQSAVPDSQMIFAPLVAGALLVWIGKKSRLNAFWFGLLVGLAYLARGYAIFLGLAWLVVTGWELIRQRDRESLLRAGCTILGLAIPVVPWLVRTYLTFGFINSPAGLQTGLIDNYATLFNFETPINFSTFVALGPGRIIQTRLDALYNAWVEVAGVMFFPTVLLPLIGLILLWRRNRSLNLTLLYGALLSLGSPLLFAVASTNGSFYHSVGSFAPYGAIGYIWLLWLVNNWYRGARKRRVSIFPVLAGVLILLELIQLPVTISTTVDRHIDEQQIYVRLANWLATQPPNPVVIANEPSTLNYATGLPSLRLPADEPLEVLQHLVSRYRARYIVITDNFGRYPALLNSAANTFFPRVFRDPKGEFEVYQAGVS